MTKLENHDDVRAILKKGFPRIRAADEEPCRDLWPAMLRKLDAHTVPQRIPWYDWALLGALAGTLAFFPTSILLFMYHL